MNLTITSVGVTQVVNVTIPKELSKIAVSFSGGMDSTLLLYLLLQDKNDNNLQTEIHCFTAPQTGRKIHTRKILQLPEFNGKVIHHEDYQNDTDEGIKPMLRSILADGWTVFTGINEVPPEHVNGRYPIRQYPDILPDGLKVPFRFLYKSHIYKAYHMLNIAHLVKFTHSCTEWEVGECGNCFACNERKWAISKL